MSESEGYYGLSVTSGAEPFAIPLPYTGEVVLGSAVDADVHLDDPDAAAKHACIIAEGARLGIVDLDSPSGVFVNGERVRKASLSLGDRVHLGSSTVEVVAINLVGEAKPRPTIAPPRIRRQSLTAEQLEQLTMSGDLADVPFADLLQLFARTKKSGELHISGVHTASVWMRDGRVVDTAIDGKHLLPLKAIARILTWQAGAFEMGTAGALMRLDGASAESLLLDALRLYDEAQPALERFPDPRTRVGLTKPLNGKLSTLSAAELDAVQIFLDVPVLSSAYESYAGTDFELAQLLATLVDKGILVVL